METRLSRLEAETTGAPWIYVVEGSDGADDRSEVFLRTCGYETAPSGLVVYIRRFSSADIMGVHLDGAPPIEECGNDEDGLRLILARPQLR
jgi:hypothetical protein